MSIQYDKIKAIIKGSAAHFLNEEAGSKSLLTVTSVSLFERNTKAIVYFTSLPDTFEEEALSFLKRKRSDFKEYLRLKTSLGRIPFIDFAIDRGERNRQKIERVSQNDKRPGT